MTAPLTEDEAASFDEVHPASLAGRMYSEWRSQRAALASQSRQLKAMRTALEAALADGDQESKKVWHGRLRHEVAVQCRDAIAAK